MSTQISLWILIRRFWKRASLTWLMVVVEGILLVLMPLVIGWAVDDLIQSRMLGLIQLGGLCTLLLIIGAGRRFYDTRVYARMYREVSGEMISREFQKQTSVSKISARTNLFTEFIEFLENAIPDIVNHFMGLSGTLVIIFFIQVKVFWLCIAGAVLTGLIFFISGNRMLALNKGQNDEFENQVALIEAKEPKQLSGHFKRLMRWNVRLSDLETINFSLTWIALSGILLSTVFLTVSSGASSFGHVITIVMYVFGFIESILTFPLYYQQMIRLQDITERLG